jgi:hypothetical protein
VRLLVLYVRSRGVPLALLAVAALSLLAAPTAAYLVGLPQFDGMARLPVAVAAALGVAVILAATLHSPTPELEASCPVPWRAWQGAHAGVALALGVALLAPVLPATTYGTGVLLRDLVGFLGLALLTAILAGPRLAWTVPCAYAATVYCVAGAGDEALRSVWAFPQQPAGSTTAWLTALTLGITGLLTWTIAGPNALAATSDR